MKTCLAIRDAADLLSALRSPSQNVRSSVLSAVRANPLRALQLGRFQGCDLIDELVHQANQSCAVPYYRALVQTLALFDDARVILLFDKLDVLASDDEVLRIVRDRLRPGDPPSAAGPLGPSVSARGSGANDHAEPGGQAGVAAPLIHLERRALRGPMERLEALPLVKELDAHVDKAHAQQGIDDGLRGEAFEAVGATELGELEALR